MKQSVKAFSNEVRELKPEYAHLDDADILELVTKKDPELLSEIDRDDLIKVSNESVAKQISKERQRQFSSMSGVSRFSAGFGAGMADVYQGIKQLFGGDVEDYKQEKALYTEATKGNKTAAFGEIMGGIAATAPLPGFTGAKLTSRFAAPLAKTAIGLGTAAAVGGGMGATEFVDDDESRSTNAAIGALFGLGSTGAAMLTKKVGAKAFNALKGRYQNASQQELMDLAKSHGIDLSLGDVTGKTGTRKAEIGLESKIGGISPDREAQAKQVNRAVDEVERLFRPNGETKPLSGSEIGQRLQESTKRSYDNAREIARKNYNKVEQLSGGARIEAKNTISEIDKVINKFGKSKTGTQPKALRELESLKTNLQDGKVNFSELRATRESLGAIAKDWATSDPESAKMIGMARKAIDYDMDDVIQAQVDRMADKTERKFQKLAGSEYINPFQKVERRKEEAKQIVLGKQLKESYEIAKNQYREDVAPYKASPTLKSILKNEEPDQIFDKMIKEDYVDRAKRFYKALDGNGREAVEYGIIKNAMNKARVETEFGANYSPLKFSNALNALDEQSKIFMSPEKKKYVDGLERVFMAAKRAGQYMENPPTGNRELIAKEIRNAKLTMGLLPLITKGEKYFSTGSGKKFLLAASDLDPESKQMRDFIEKHIEKLPKSLKTKVYEPGSVAAAAQVTEKELEE